MKFILRSDSKGKLEMSDYTRRALIDFAKKNPSTPFEIEPQLPESNKLRRYFEGCLIPLVTFYQEHLDYHNAEDRAQVREWIKLEWNAQFIQVDQKAHKVAGSTKGRKELNPLCEKLQEYLVEQHATPNEALDPKNYKHWRDAVFQYRGPDNYIDYLVETGVLKRKT